jgi:hypothetical protein
MRARSSSKEVLPLPTAYESARQTACFPNMQDPNGTESEPRTRCEDPSLAEEAVDTAEHERMLRMHGPLQFTAVGGRAAEWAAQNEAKRPVRTHPIVVAAEPPPASRSAGELRSIGGSAQVPAAIVSAGSGSSADRLLGSSEEAQRLRMERFARALVLPTRADTAQSQYPKW